MDPHADLPLQTTHLPSTPRSAPTPAIANLLHSPPPATPIGTNNKRDNTSSQSSLLPTSFMEYSPTFSNHLTPYTPNTPFCLDNDLLNFTTTPPNSTNHNFSYNHSRTISLPSPISFNQNSSINNINNRFSLPAIVDPTISLQNHLNSINLNSESNSIITPLTRRNTLFSNASTSSNATSISIINNSLDLNNSINSPLNLNLSNLSNNELLSLSKDQNGCRMLQKLIDDDLKINLPLIFNLAYKNSTILMLDPFGNYLIQKIIIHASPSQLSLILMDISLDIQKIATNLHGTRALQKLISCLSTSNHHDLIVIAISPIIVQLIHDLNGNHVIQKLISHYNNNDLNFLIDLVILHLIPIATHKHGCCVLQKLMNKCSQLQIQKITNEILKNCVLLMKDQFGNYVIQYLISLNINSINYTLLQIVSNELISLSCGKFSSNVVEKCLKLNPIPNSIHPLIASLINFNILMTLIKDQYGNYVVQTALDLADLPIKHIMAELIKPALSNIKYSTYGKRIYNKVVLILTQSQLSTNQQQLNLLPGINFCKN